MDAAPQHIIDWVGQQILPHEAHVRGCLRRARISREDIEDIIQESYCRLAALSSVDHVLTPRAYFLTVAKNIARVHIRRARIVRMESIDEIERLDITSDTPSPERIVVGRAELARLQTLISSLPERCRRVFVMRKVEGLPQREIARILGVSETIIENDAAKGLRLIMRAISSEDSRSRPNKETRRDAGVERN
jgi:RNA polymerase sigma-70 factor (ECF subfamily)